MFGWQGRMPDRPGRTKRMYRICWEHLAEDSVKMVFSSHLQQSFDCALGVGDMESNQATFCTAIVKMAVQSFGYNVVGACCDSNMKPARWTTKVKDAIKLMKESYKAWLACWTG